MATPGHPDVVYGSVPKLLSKYCQGSSPLCGSGETGAPDYQKQSAFVEFLLCTAHQVQLPSPSCLLRPESLASLQNNNSRPTI